MTILILNCQFPIIDGNVPCSPSHGVYISQLIQFARAYSHVADFNTRNKHLTEKLLKEGYQNHTLHKTFSKFYRGYYDSMSKFHVGLKSFLHQGLSELLIFCFSSKAALHLWILFFICVSYLSLLCCLVCPCSFVITCWEWTDYLGSLVHCVFLFLSPSHMVFWVRYGT